MDARRGLPLAVWKRVRFGGGALVGPRPVAVGGGDRSAAWALAARGGFGGSGVRRGMLVALCAGAVWVLGGYWLGAGVDREGPWVWVCLWRYGLAGWAVA